MPDNLMSVIRNARLRMGEAPRRFDAELTQYLLPQRWWSSLVVSSSRQASDASFRMLLKKGQVVWSVLVVAKAQLLKEGRDDGHAIVTYCPEYHVHDNMTGIESAARTLYELRQKKVESKEEIELQRLIYNNAQFTPRSLPKSISDDSRIRCSSVAVKRKHLTDRILRGNYIPILAHPEIDAIAIVPEQFWPWEQKEYWLAS